MMTTKSTTSLRDRRISPFPARPSQKALLFSGDNTTPTEAKKPMLNNLKLKSVPSSESPTQRIPIVPTIITNATSKTASARRLSDKAPLPSAPALQRSLKPATPMPKRSSSSMLHGNKVAQTISRTARTSLVPKEKSTSTLPVMKKDAPVTIDTTSEVMISLDHDAVTASEKPVHEQLWNNHKKVDEALNELNNVEESKFVCSLGEVENHVEEQKSGEPDNWGEVVVPHEFAEASKETVVLEEVEEVSKQALVAVAFTQEEKRGEEKKLEHVDAVVRRVDPEVRKPMLGVTVATVVTAMKKKDAPISNDVIEETKSKLMGMRKNRVLALVGAFETVISLQEPEGQQIQKALQVQLEQQIPQVQQAEQRFLNKKNQLGVESQQNQEAREDQNAQQLGSDEFHQVEQKLQNGEHEEKEEKGENAMLKEQGIDALERGEEEEDETPKEGMRPSKEKR